MALLDDYQDVALRCADWGALGADVEVVAFRDHLTDEGAIAERLRDFEVVVAMRERTPFPRTLLARLPKLRLLITTGSRNPTIDVESARAQGVVVCTTGGLGYPTAELTWGLILALVRQIPAEERAIRAGGWQTTLGVGLQGKTLGVIGLGNLGSQVARVGAAFGMQVVAWSQNLTAARAEECGAALVTKEALLAQSDVVTIHLVLSDRTRGLLGARELALLRPTAYLVNTSRGPIVDEAALVEALQGRRIAGAALDVFDVEPLPWEHPFRRLENVVVTPHIGYVTAETYAVFYRHALENIAAFRAGAPRRVLEHSTI